MIFELLELLMVGGSRGGNNSSPLSVPAPDKVLFVSYELISSLTPSQMKYQGKEKVADKSICRTD